MTAFRRASGHTMIEMVVAMVVLGVVGAAIVRLIVAESRGFQGQDSSQEARKVARAAVNLMTSDLRMVEVTGGVAAASPTSITLRVPYAMGIVCDAGTISTMPVDSLLFAQAIPGGYAWRDDAGAYTYVTSGVTASVGSAGLCTTPGITTLTGGKVLSIAPTLPAGALVGAPVFLFQTVTYWFGSSGLLPGRTGLFRRVGASVVSTAGEEIAAPFDPSSNFAFFVLNANTSQASAPANLADLRGVELNLVGASRYIPRTRSTYKTEPLTTAIFFQNRLP